MTLFGIICAVAAHQVAMKARERLAVEKILKLGGTVQYDWEVYGTAAEAYGAAWIRRLLGDDCFSTVAFVGLEGKELKGAELKCVSGVPQLRQIYLLDNPGISADGLSYVLALRRLEVLRLDARSCNDDSARSIALCTSLRWLDLPGTSISDEGVRALLTLPSIMVLDLSCTDITDASASLIARKKGITELLLDGTAITDCGLRDLGELTSLESLSIRSTGTTDAGVAILKTRLPYCVIYK